MINVFLSAFLTADFCKRVFSLSCVFSANQKMISEQPCSNGETIRHTVQWEEIRTSHKPSGIYFYIYCANYCFSICTRTVTCSTKTENVGLYHTWPSWYKNWTIIRTVNVKVNPRRRHVCRNLLYLHSFSVTFLISTDRRSKTVFVLFSTANKQPKNGTSFFLPCVLPKWQIMGFYSRVLSGFLTPHNFRLTLLTLGLRPFLFYCK